MIKSYISSKYRGSYTKCYEKKDTHVIALIIFYESKTKYSIKVYGVLSYVQYYITENYVFIDYLCCKSKKLSSISSDKIFEQGSYNMLLVIVIL